MSQSWIENPHPYYDPLAKAVDLDTLGTEIEISLAKAQGHVNQALDGNPWDLYLAEEEKLTVLAASDEMLGTTYLLPTLKEAIAAQKLNNHS